MKYFQNVVDTVRDLMSPNAEEQHYKNGMRKDPDGFMDIEWCETKVLHTWNDLRQTFQLANARKAIAPTQFNPMSTRGHCIMVLEVEMPHPENEGMKQRGRLYVCDLAGTEPAGDIVCAQYQKVTFDDGTFEYKFMGPHPDKNKSKELQEQGKKINLSLSEMALFFMKMAEAVTKKKLKPGDTIPGCNSFFLCKYLKDTMLQAKTYLFCAIRPEVTFLKYTFATLGFAKNASVVRLAPKKATVAASAAERRLMVSTTLNEYIVHVVIIVFLLLRCIECAIYMCRLMALNEIFSLYCAQSLLIGGAGRHEGSRGIPAGQPRRRHCQYGEQLRVRAHDRRAAGQTGGEAVRPCQLSRR